MSNIEKIGGFHYPVNQQSAFDSEEMTALELSARTAAKTNECVDKVNAVVVNADEALTALENAQAAVTAANSAIVISQTANNNAVSAIENAQAAINSFEEQTDDINDLITSINNAVDAANTAANAASAAANTASAAANAASAATLAVSEDISEVTAAANAASAAANDASNRANIATTQANAAIGSINSLMESFEGLNIQAPIKGARATNSVGYDTDYNYVNPLIQCGFITCAGNGTQKVTSNPITFRDAYDVTSKPLIIMCTAHSCAKPLADGEPTREYHPTGINGEFIHAAPYIPPTGTEFSITLARTVGNLSASYWYMAFWIAIGEKKIS